MNGLFKQISLWLIVIILLALALSHGFSTDRPGETLTVADFQTQLSSNNIESVEITRRSDDYYRYNVRFKEPVRGNATMEFKWRFPEAWEEELKAQGLATEIGEENTVVSTLLINILPILIIIGLFWFFMIRQMQGGSNKAMSFGKSRARLVNHSDKVVTFNDVAGVDEAKEELQEIIEFLRDPKRFSRLGGKIPKGVLLVGSPGTGKTLLARAVAGEAHVPFFSISGSDFVEMFVGVGASRVRDLFQQGQKHAPCIIFIDEIDAVGRQRGAGLGGGHDEREQTLNQLLVEMDGFNTSDGVILMAATNRPDVLDKALLRPGRFDRQIVVANPDIRGREEILNIHINNNHVPVDESMDITMLARGTSGFSGADLANMVNEAALLAARRNQETVTMDDFEEAKDRVLMGPERRSLVISPKEKRNTAYHEAGHVLVGRLLGSDDIVHKVTVIPRGPSLGLTSILPSEDRHNLTKSYCLAQIRMLMGGRAAEEAVFGEFTSGAANDLKVATQRAHAMVCNWGMSDLGPISFGSSGEVFLGRDFVREREFSEETAAAVDKEIHKILDEAYKDAKQIIVKHRNVLDAIADELVERETLDAKDIDEIIKRVGGPEILLAHPEKKDKTPPRKKDKSPHERKKASGAEPAPAPPGDIVPGTA